MAVFGGGRKANGRQGGNSRTDPHSNSKRAALRNFRVCCNERGLSPPFRPGAGANRPKALTAPGPFGEKQRAGALCCRNEIRKVVVPEGRNRYEQEYRLLTGGQSCWLCTHGSRDATRTATPLSWGVCHWSCVACASPLGQRVEAEFDLKTIPAPPVARRGIDLDIHRPEVSAHWRDRQELSM